MILERDVEGYLCGKVEQRGGICMKCGQDGWPDRLVLLPAGVVVWVETKRPRGRVAPLQTYRRAQLERVGQRVETLWTKAQVDEFLARV